MKRAKRKNQSKALKAKKTRSRIKLGKNNYRLSVFRSNKNLYAQLIDDSKGETVASASIKSATAKESKDMTKGLAQAFALGQLIAEKAKAKKIEKAVFDRGSYAYHGKVKALAEGAREGGLKI
ncbi:MAG: 50S ribosomal protein L18 [bacterium]|nr:50S ribosomal protein L18 [bacterium]